LGYLVPRGKIRGGEMRSENQEMGHPSAQAEECLEVVLQIAEFSQLSAAPAGRFSLLDALHLTLADVERVSLYRRKHVSLKILLQSAELPLELTARVAAFTAVVTTALAPKVAALIIVALSGQLQSTSSLLVPDRKPQSATPGCNQRWLRCPMQIVLDVALGLHLRAVCI
jgi:hypothetical protein